LAKQKKNKNYQQRRKKNICIVATFYLLGVQICTQLEPQFRGGEAFRRQEHALFLKVVRIHDPIGLGRCFEIKGKSSYIHAEAYPRQG